MKIISNISSSNNMILTITSIYILIHTTLHIASSYKFIYRIRPNNRPYVYPDNRPPPQLFTLLSLIIAHLTIFFLTFYFIFTYHRPLDDLLALVVENKFT